VQYQRGAKRHEACYYKQQSNRSHVASAAVPVRQNQSSLDVLVYERNAQRKTGEGKRGAYDHGPCVREKLHPTARHLRRVIVHDLHDAAAEKALQTYDGECHAEQGPVQRESDGSNLDRSEGLRQRQRQTNKKGDQAWAQDEEIGMIDEHSPKIDPTGSPRLEKSAAFHVARAAFAIFQESYRYFGSV